MKNLLILFLSIVVLASCSTEDEVVPSSPQTPNTPAVVENPVEVETGTKFNFISDRIDFAKNARTTPAPDSLFAYIYEEGVYDRSEVMVFDDTVNIELDTTIYNAIIFTTEPVNCFEDMSWFGFRNVDVFWGEIAFEAGKYARNAPIPVELEPMNNYYTLEIDGVEDLARVEVTLESLGGFSTKYEFNTCNDITETKEFTKVGSIEFWLYYEMNETGFHITMYNSNDEVIHTTEGGDYAAMLWYLGEDINLRFDNGTWVEEIQR